MSVQIRSVLKKWFGTGKKPTAVQFADWIDSFYHKSEDSIAASSITGLQTLLDEKVTDAPSNGTSYVRKDGDWATLTIDDEPTEDSENAVSSGGVYTALENKVDAEDGKSLSTNDFTDDYKSKVDAINERYQGTYTTLAALIEAVPDGEAGWEAIIDAGEGTDAQKAVWDTTDSTWVIAGGGTITTDSTPTEDSTNAVTSGGVYTALEDKVDKEDGKGLSTNDFTDDYKSKVDAINERYQGTYTTLASLIEAVPDGEAGWEAIIDAGEGTDAQKAVWDTTDSTWVIAGGGTITTDSTPTEDSTNAVTSGGVYTALEKKADKVTDATEDNLPALDSEGNLKDSGIAADTVLNTSNVDVSSIEVGEKMLMTIEKSEDETAVVGDAVELLDKLAGSSLEDLLAEDQEWDGDEITLTGDNLTGGLGENSQEYYIGSDFFLCISHSLGTDSTDGWATWRRNRGQDALNPDLTQDAAIIAELTDDEAEWTDAGYLTVTTKSKMGTWYRPAAGGWLYMCIDTSNGWTRIGEPDSVDMEITSTSHITLTTNLAAYDFDTNGLYDESADEDNETAYQGQEWWDEENGAVYKRNMNGYWAKIF